jgi:hypothetical protein
MIRLFCFVLAAIARHGHPGQAYRTSLALPALMRK